VYNLIDQPDPWKTRDDAADSIDHEVAAQDGGRILRAVADATQRERNQA
jgi:hypothetical protein